MNKYRFRGFVRYMEPDRGFGGGLTWFFISGVGAVFGQGYSLVLWGEYLHALSASLELPHPRAVLAIEIVRVFIRVMIFVGCVTGLWLFANDDRRTPAFWTVYFTAAIPLDLAFGVLGVAISALAGDESILAAMRAHTPETALPIAIDVAWGMYWRRSRRVRNTYGYTGWRWPPPTGEPEYWPA